VSSNTRELLWEDVVQPGATWSHILRRGTALRMTDLEGGANVGAIFYNAENPTERYNMPDTLKAQHIARLTAGNVLYSDMGRVLCSITSDSLGWHDPIAGCGNAKLTAARYGEARYQECHNDCHKNALDSFVIELAKYGLGRRDLTANVNFFSKVSVSDTGVLKYAREHSIPGSHVELRAEMNVLIILNTCPHPLDPRRTFEPKPVKVGIYRVPPAAADDPCRISCPENGRGFTLTERYFMGARA
jgi:urea carboxylase-associated protein 2